MWQQMSEDGFGGGGFDTSANFGKQSDGKEDKKGDRIHTMFPVTARQVLESSEDGLVIGEMDVNKPIVKLVGIVKSIEVTSIKIVYTLEDNTGSINGNFWIDGDDPSSINVPVVENTYCAMFGTIRSQGESKYIMVFSIHPITDVNEITYHMMEVIHISLKAEQIVEQDKQPSIKYEMASSYGDKNGEKYTNSFGLNPQQQRVYKAITQCPAEGGATVEYISSVLTTKMPPKEISKIIEFLVSEGHAYSSIDDFHFKSTESSTFD